MIKDCTCEHKEQDRLHGKGKRVYNKGEKMARCTVCKHEAGVGSAEETKGGKKRE